MIRSVRFSRAIDLYVEDQRAEGWMNAAHRARVSRHPALPRRGRNNRDPAYMNRDDVKRTLARWAHPNTRSEDRAILVSFYDWLVEGPSAHQSRPPDQASP